MCDLLVSFLSHYHLSITFSRFDTVTAAVLSVCKFFFWLVELLQQSRNVKRAYFPSARNAEPVPFNNNSKAIHRLLYNVPIHSTNSFQNLPYTEWAREKERARTSINERKISISTKKREILSQQQCKHTAETDSQNMARFMVGFDPFVLIPNNRYQFSGWRDFLKERMTFSEDFFFRLKKFWFLEKVFFVQKNSWNTFAL